MREVFTKPLEQVVAEDIGALTGWPESLVFEFKEDLTSQGGTRKQPHPWHSGGRLDDYAKTKILKELVAFAKTSGGSLILGVAESTTKPPIATSIKPIPRCVDLAEALERAAQSIDPPIPLLRAHGVPMASDGAGVVVSAHRPRAAPHRSTDKECYIRRGTSSVPMGLAWKVVLTVRHRHRVVASERGLYKCWRCPRAAAGLRFARFVEDAYVTAIVLTKSKRSKTNG